MLANNIIMTTMSYNNNNNNNDDDDDDDDTQKGNSSWLPKKSLQKRGKKYDANNCQSFWQSTG